MGYYKQMHCKYRTENGRNGDLYGLENCSFISLEDTNKFVKVVSDTLEQGTMIGTIGEPLWRLPVETLNDVHTRSLWQCSMVFTSETATLEH